MTVLLSMIAVPASFTAVQPPPVSGVWLARPVPVVPVKLSCPNVPQQPVVNVLAGADAGPGLFICHDQPGTGGAHPQCGGSLIQVVGLCGSVRLAAAVDPRARRALAPRTELVVQRDGREGEDGG